MKKFFSLLILPLVAIICLCGCGEEYTSQDLSKLYNQIKEVCIIDSSNKFFSDEARPNSIVIDYASDVKNVINSTIPSNKLAKKYAVLGYQQKILDNIFNYYEKNQENFYLKMSSAKVDKNEMNDLYSSLQSLKSQLTTFKNAYNTFCDATESGVSDVMEFNLSNYSFELNRVIDKSFDFIYKFIDLNNKYCVSNADIIAVTPLENKIQKSYVDIAYIVYLNNFKAFDYSVGSKGIADDLDSIILNSNKYSLIDNLNSIKTLSSAIIAGMQDDNPAYETTMELINNYLYSCSVFDQRLTTYVNTYNEQDIYKITQYKFGLIAGVDYDSYLDTLTKSKRASLVFMDDFVSDVYNKLIYDLSLIVA